MFKQNVQEANQPIQITFDNLNVKVDNKYILENVSGEIRPGEILAIMGPSGAGKSTLLNLLAGREKAGIEVESGHILINNQKATKRLRRGIGYVLQEDVFYSHLTVKQTLEFVGELRLSDSLKKSEKNKIVNEVVEQLGLKKCLNTVMGGGLFVTGCSGGEKKRCSIAVELITNPALLMMDEPTSGLDSSTAWNLMEAVKNLAKSDNRAVVTTIHQPSSHVFHMFDKIMLLCNGKVAYYGKTSGVLKFFEHIKMPCYANWNPADFVMEQLTAGKEIEDQIVEKFEKFKRNPDTKAFCEDTEIIQNGYTVKCVQDDASLKSPDELRINQCGSDDIDGDSDDVHVQIFDKATEDISNKAKRWPTGYRTQAAALCKRAFIQTKHDLWDKLGFVQTMLIALSASLIWFNTPYTESAIHDRKGVMFFTLVFLVVEPMFFVLMTFPAERSVIAKERAAGMYRLSAYYTAKCVSELPIITLRPVVLYTVVYWMAGLNRSPLFLVAIMLILTIAVLGQSLGLCIGGMVKDLKQSITVTIVFALTMMMLAGFYTKDLPYWLEWAKYTSHITYAYNILVKVEFTYAANPFRCALKNSVFESCNRNGTRYIDNVELTDYVSLIDLGVAESFAVLWLYILFLGILFYYILKFFNKPN